jgi:hypothetical protein
MKKVILATLMAGLIPMIASAQGTVTFASSSANHRVYQTDGVTPVGAGYSAALYWGTLGSLEGALVQIGATTGVNSANGLLVNGGTRTTGPATPAGQQATFQVRAWNGAFSTYELAFAGAQASSLFGRTTPFANPTGNPNDTPPGTPSNLTGWTTPIVVSAIPEPSTIALAGLGVASLLLFRRRK